MSGRTSENTRIVPKFGWAKIHKWAGIIGLPICIGLAVLIEMHDDNSPLAEMMSAQWASLIALMGCYLWVAGMGALTALIVMYSILVATKTVHSRSGGFSGARDHVKTTIKLINQATIEILPAAGWALLWIGLASLPQILESPIG